MRKNVLFSLIAASSASMVAYADADLSNQIKNDQVTDWTGATDDFTFDDRGALVSPGTSVSQTIGKLLPGIYKFTANKDLTSSNVKFTVTVNGTAVENVAQFDLTEEAEVAVKIESTDGLKYTAGGLKLELVYPFDVTKNELTQLLSEVTNRIDIYAPNGQTLIQAGSAIQTKINELKDDNGTHVAYDVYKKYEFWKGQPKTKDNGEIDITLSIEKCTIKSEIDALKEKVEGAVNNNGAYEAATTAYTELIGSWNEDNAKFNTDNHSEYAINKFKSEFEAIKSDIEAFKADAEEAYNNQTAGIEFTPSVIEDFKTKTTSRLTAVKEGLTKADADDVAFVAVSPIIAKAKEAYTTNLQSIIENLSDETYADWRTEAQEKLAQAYAKISEAEKNNGTKESHDNAAETKDANTALIAEANTTINSIPEYITKAEECRQAYKDAKASVDAAVKSYEGYKSIIADKFADDIKAIDEQIADLRNEIEKANSAHTIVDFNANTLNNSLTAITNKINALESEAGSVIDNYKANNEVAGWLKNLQKTLNDTKSEVAKLKSEDGKYTASGRYTETEQELQSLIDKFTADLAKAYAENSAVDYRDAKYDSIHTVVPNDIMDYFVAAEGARNNYNSFVKTKNAIDKALTTLKGTVKNTLVWVNGSSSDKNTTYGDKIKQYETLISKANSDLNSALALNEDKHVEAMDELTISATAEGEITALNGSYATDEQFYNENVTSVTAQKLHTQIVERIDVINNSLTDLSDESKYNGTTLGIYFDAPTEGFVTIKKQITGAVTSLQTTENDKYNAGSQNNYSDYTAYVGEATKELLSIENAIASLRGKVEEAISRVSANNEAQEALKETIDELTIELKGNSTDKESVLDLNEDPDRKEEFEGKFDKLNSKITEAETEIEAECKAETLVQNKDAYINELNTILTEIKSLQTEAKNSTTNYNVYTRINKKLTDTGINAAIDKAVNDINTAIGSSNEAYAHYYNLLKVGNGSYTAQLNNLASSITKNYTDRKYTSYTEDQIKAVEKQITDLKAAVEAVPVACAANEKAFKEQTDSLTKTQTVWNDAYALISNEDESSKKTVWLNLLADIQLTITEYSNNITTYHKNGTSESNAVAVEDALTEIQKNIQNILDDRDGQYDEIIAADNAAAYDEFTAELEKTVAVYNNAVSVINQYNNIQDSYIKERIEEELNKQSEAIYAYSAKLLALKNEARAEYISTPSRVVFDNSEFVTTAQQYASDIDGCLDAISNKVSRETNTRLNNYITSANSLLNQKKSQIANYNEDIQKDAFKDVEDVIANWKKYINHNELPIKIDGFSTESNQIPSMLDKDLYNASYKQWNAECSEFDSNNAKWTEDLNKYQFEGIENDRTNYTNTLNNETTGYEAIKNNFNTFVSGGANYYEAYTTYSVELSNLVASLKSIHDNAKSQFESNEANKTGYATSIKYIEDLQDSLVAAKEYADAYYFVNKDFESNVATWQSMIDNITEKVTGAFNSGEIDKDYPDGIKSECVTVREEIKFLYNSANIAERDGLVTEIDNVRKLYNEVLAKVAGTEAESTVVAYDAQIVELEKEIEEKAETVIGVEGKDLALQAEFIAMEKAIADIQYALNTISDSNTETTAYNEVVAAWNELKALYDAQVEALAACHTNVQTMFAETMETLLADINSVKTSIDGYYADHNILFYKDKSNNAIALLKEDVAELSENIVKEQEIYKVNQEVYNKLKAELDGYATRLSEVIAVIEGYQNDAFTSTFEDYEPYNSQSLIAQKSEDVNKWLEALNETLQNAYEKNELDATDTNDATKTSNIVNSINELEEDVAYNESDTRGAYLLYSKIDALLNKLKNINYHYINNDELEALAEALKTKVKNVKGYNIDAKDGKLNNKKDIDGNTLTEVKEVVYMDEVAKVFERYNEYAQDFVDIDALADEYVYVLGDVDRDRVYSVNDYNKILNISLGRLTPEEEAKYAPGTIGFLTADCNEDGSINIGDVTWIANKTKNGTPIQYYAKSRMRLSASQPTIVSDALSLSAETQGATQRIAINLTGSMAYAGCQMDIKLPAGMVLVSESLGSRANGHNLYSNDLSDGVHRVIVSSLDGNNFTDAEDAILYLEVSGNANVNSIVVENVLFSDNKGLVYSVEGTGEGTTGIDGVTNDQSLKSRIYNVGGQLLDTVKKGINIIRNSDGTTKKILK